MTNIPVGPADVAVVVAALRRDFREYYVFYGVVTREFVALDRRPTPWREAAAHPDPNALAAMLRAHRDSPGR